jgi:hypothetical protein
VASILPVLALFQVFDALNGVASGIMRARGMQVNFVSSLSQNRPDYLYGIVCRCPIEYKVRPSFGHTFELAVHLRGFPSSAYYMLGELSLPTPELS